MHNARIQELESDLELSKKLITTTNKELAETRVELGKQNIELVNERNSHFAHNYGAGWNFDLLPQ